MRKPKNKRTETFAQRVNRVSRELSRRRERKQEKAEQEKSKARKDFAGMTRPLRRKQTPSLEKVVRNLRPIIAYDLETTSIKPGTPHPLYLTACGAQFWFSGEILSVKHLCDMLIERFLLRDLSGTRFVAWNGNHFDVYLVAMALLRSPDYILRPYLTRSRNLRGLRVILRQYDEYGFEITEKCSKSKKEVSWEFLDAIAMTGMTGKPLKDFLKTFAPDWQKLEGPDFEREQFNPRNPDHVKYAERDSEGLYHGLMAARKVVLESFAIDLCPTIGNMGIKILQRHIPKQTECWRPPAKAARTIRDQVMRGGFCFCVQRYRGPVWKYDLNQAYAAAMRDAALPAGRCIWTEGRHPYAKVYIARVKAKNFRNRIPFYYRDIERGRSVFGLQEIGETWLTSIEIAQLEREGWTVEILESWFWDDDFNLRDYVNKLENLRIGNGRNPKDAQGEIMKMIGNNSYGKTVEQLDGLELVMASEAPEGFSPYAAEVENLQYIWFKIGTPMLREYHQPQIGAFVTAHVRMLVRRAALQDPDTWLYADTDCVMFSQTQTADLNIDPGKYGAWKIEEEGTEFLIAAKKVYASADGKQKHAKGLNVRKLTPEDFEKWIAGAPPEQVQVQRQNFMLVMSGFDMFIERKKVGERL